MKNANHKNSILIYAVEHHVTADLESAQPGPNSVAASAYGRMLPNQFNPFFELCKILLRTAPSPSCLRIVRNPIKVALSFDGDSDLRHNYSSRRCNPCFFRMR